MTPTAHTGSTAARRATAMPPAARRAAIIAAVLPLLSEHGDRITSRQIADAAGIAEGTIFRVFTDKNELIVAAVDAALDPAPLEDAIKAIDPEQPLDTRLIAVTELLQRRTEHIWKLISGLATDVSERVKRPLSASPALIELFESERDRLRIEPAAAAHLLRALTLSLTHPMLASDPANARDIVDVVLHGVARPDAEPGDRRSM